MDWYTYLLMRGFNFHLCFPLHSCWQRLCQTHIQEIIGVVLLFYGSAIDSTLVAALGTIVMQQISSSTKTMDSIPKTLEYCATNPVSIIRFHASNMVFHTNSDAALDLSATKALLAIISSAANPRTQPKHLILPIHLLPAMVQSTSCATLFAKS
jgi:hypothetical protein